jgi:quinol monooxygenase YgiN
VSYTETLPSAKASAVSAFRAYRTASLRQDGYVRFELFEQLGRPGHFAIVETWRDQKAFESRGNAQKDLTDALQPIRTSDYDQRPYKTLTVGPQPTSAGRQAVYVVTHVDVSMNPAVPVLLRQLAESVRQWPGNLRFDVLQHTMRANHFTIVEAWQDDKARESHAAAAHTRKYRDDLAPMTGSPLDERVYMAVE